MSFDQADKKECKKSFVYEIYLSGLHVGSLHRNIVQQREKIAVNTRSHISLLGLSSDYQQQSQLHWSATENRFLSDYFSQQMSGIKTRQFETLFINKNKQTIVNLNGQINRYQNEQGPLLDIDAFDAQIRENVKTGKQKFTLYRQGAEEIKSYTFVQTGKEKIKSKYWGEVETIRLKETEKYKGTLLWYSPEHDFQLIKAEFSDFISPTVYLSEMEIFCD